MKTLNRKKLFFHFFLLSCFNSTSSIAKSSIANPQDQIEIIPHKKNQLLKESPSINEENLKSINHLYPVVIIGSGPAGQSAALFLSRAGITPLIIEGKMPLGAMAQSLAVENWPSAPKVTGGQLMGAMQKQNINNGTLISSSTALSIIKDKGIFRIKLISHSGEIISIQSAYVIFAAGSTPNQYEPLKNKAFLFSKGVHTCAHCDGMLFKNKAVGVVGGGDNAINEALYLSSICKEVNLFIRRDEFKSKDQKKIDLLKKKSNINIHFNTEIENIQTEKEIITGVEVIKKIDGAYKSDQIQLNGLFLAIGYKPNTKIIQTQINENKIEVDESGYIRVNQNQETSLPHFFAAGDVADPIYKQAITASADGVKSAFSIIHSIDTDFPDLSKNNAQKLKAPFAKSFSRIIEIDTDEAYLALKEQVKYRKTNILVIYSAKWCKACNMINPVLEELSVLFGDKVVFARIDVDQFKAVAEKAKIKALPTVIAFDTNKKRHFLEGFQPIIEYLLKLAEKQK